MGDPVLEAAQALTPLLAAGADGAIGEVTRQAGESAAAAARSVIEKIRRSLDSDAPSEETVAGVLRSELEQGNLSRADLLRTVETIRLGHDNRMQVKGNAYIGNSIDIKGDFHG